MAATAADAGAGAGMERDEEEKTGPGDDEEEGGGGCWRRSEVRSEKREGKSRCGCDWERAAMVTESDSLELGGGMVTSTFTFTFTYSAAPAWREGLGWVGLGWRRRSLLHFWDVSYGWGPLLLWALGRMASS